MNAETEETVSRYADMDAFFLVINGKDSHAGSGTISKKEKAFEIRYARSVGIRFSSGSAEEGEEAETRAKPVPGTARANHAEELGEVMEVVKAEDRELCLKTGTATVKVYLPPSMQSGLIQSLLSRSL
jgi:hypothetical protein